MNEITPTSSAKAFFFELIKVVALSLAIIVPVRVFLMQPFIVRGASMEPNYHNREYLIVNKLAYHLRDPQRGDVVVFKAPGFTDYFIKRVIGLPGERIVLENGKITIFNESYPDGLPISETPYLDSSVYTSGSLNVLLRDNEYFVFGDNRGNSSDSRYFGAVPRDRISGITWLRLFPFSKITHFTNTFDYAPTL